MSNTPHSKISLVGAGPGDPELITLKAIRVIQSADVVLYDALVSEDVLKLIPENVPAWSVGKRAGVHSFKQEEINTLLVDFANKYGHVVRLKGGDPFVFGRGHEEVEFAISKGIEVNVVPGISSALAVPASVSIPLTRRHVSESFWVVTGTTKTGDLSNDIKLAIQSTATIVILMGINKIQEIVEILLREGKDEVPIAVIQNGTLPNQRAVAGFASTIVNDITKSEIGSPAIIVIGEVVRFSSIEEIKESLINNGISLAGQM